MKVAIIGAGQIADAHINELSKISEASLEAICDLNRSPLLALQEKYGIPHSFTDIDSLLSEVSPDVVHVTSPPSTHLGIAKKCIAHGAHLYVEKPVTERFADAEQLVQEADKKGLKLCMGVNRVRAKAQVRAVEMIRAGDLGELRHIDAYFTYDLKGPFGKQVLSNPDHWISRLPGQVIQNNLNHPLSVIVPFLGDDLVVDAWADDWSGNGVVFDELRVRIIDRSNQLTANIILSSNTKPGGFTVSYRGSEASVHVDNSFHVLTEWRAPKLPGVLGGIFSTRSMAKQYSRQFRRRLFEFVFGKETFFTDMQRLMRDFYLAIDGSGELPVSTDEILASARLIDEVVNQIGRPGDTEGRVSK